MGFVWLNFKILKKDLNVLTDNKHVSSWIEAYLLGNGRFGAMFMVIHIMNRFNLMRLLFRQVDHTEMIM